MKPVSPPMKRVGAKSPPQPPPEFVATEAKTLKRTVRRKKAKTTQ